MKKNVFTFIMVAALFISATAQSQTRKSDYSMLPPMSEKNKQFTDMLFPSVSKTDFNTQKKIVKSNKMYKPSSKGTVFISETFETEIPDTWTINNTGYGNFPCWFWTEFAYDMESTIHPAGSYKLPFTGFAIINSHLNFNPYKADTHTAGELTSPTFDATTAVNSVALDFEYFYTDYYQSDEVVQVHVWDGTTWQIVADLTYNSVGTPDKPVFVSIDITDYKNSEMQIRFVADDDAEGGGNAGLWAIDNITVYETDDHDLAVFEAEPTIVINNESAYPEVLIHNYGYTTETDFTVEVIITDGVSEIYSSSKTLNSQSLALTENMLVTMDKRWTTPLEGTYYVTATVTLDGDAVTENNSKTVECIIDENIAEWYGYLQGGVCYHYGPSTIYKGAGRKIDILKERHQQGEYPAFSSEWIDGEYYDMEFSTDLYAGKIHKVNKETGEYIEMGTGVEEGSGFTYDPVTETTYITNYYGEFFIFEDGVSTSVGNEEWIVWDSPNNNCQMITGIACVGDGIFYVSVKRIDYDPNPVHYESKIYRYDLNTETSTYIGILSDKYFGHNSNLTYDWDNDIFYIYLVELDENNDWLSNGIFSVDMETLETELVIDLDFTFITIAIPYTSGAKLVTTTPYNAEEDVACDGTVSAEFDVDLTEIDLSEVIIEDENGEWSGNYTASVSGISPNTIEFTHDNFTGYTEYVVIIPKGSVSDGTRELDRDIIWRFTTGEGIVDVNETMQTHVDIYPNPSTGIFTIATTENYKINILDISGRVVYISETNTSISQIDLSNIAKGVYFIELSNENEKINRKIVIE